MGMFKQLHSSKKLVVKTIDAKCGNPVDEERLRCEISAGGGFDELDDVIGRFRIDALGRYATKIFIMMHVLFGLATCGFFIIWLEVKPFHSSFPTLWAICSSVNRIFTALIGFYCAIYFNKLGRGGNHSQTVFAIISFAVLGAYHFSGGIKNLRQFSHGGTAATGVVHIASSVGLLICLVYVCWTRKLHWWHMTLLLINVGFHITMFSLSLNMSATGIGSSYSTYLASNEIFIHFPIYMTILGLSQAGAIGVPVLMVADAINSALWWKAKLAWGESNPLDWVHIIIYSLLWLAFFVGLMWYQHL